MLKFSFSLGRHGMTKFYENGTQKEINENTYVSCDSLGAVDLTDDINETSFSSTPDDDHPIIMYH